MSVWQRLQPEKGGPSQDEISVKSSSNIKSVCCISAFFMFCLEFGGNHIDMKMQVNKN